MTRAALLVNSSGGILAGERGLISLIFLCFVFQIKTLILYVNIKRWMLWLSQRFIGYCAYLKPLQMKTYLISILAIVVLSCSSGEKKCTVTGGVTGGNSKALLLFKASGYPEQEAEIPISNGRFTYSFDIDQPEVYWLILKDKFKKGSANEIPFFGEGGKIEISINAENQAYEVKGHRLNDALFDYYREMNKRFLNESMKYKDSVNLMYRNGTVYTPEFRVLQEAVQKATDPNRREQLMEMQRNLKGRGAMYNPKAKLYVQMQDSIAAAQKAWELEYIEKNTTLPALYLFMQKVKKYGSANNVDKVDTGTIEVARKNLERFSSKFPGHPYCVIIENKLKEIKV